MRHIYLAVATACGALLLQGCLSSGGSGSSRPVETEKVDLSDFDVESAAYCDHTVLGHCLYPFPNNLFTREDGSTPTGLRIDFDIRAMPVAQPVDMPASPDNTRFVPIRTTEATPIEPTQWNRNDGFSPGSMLLAHLPGIDLERTGAVRITDIEPSLDPDAPVLVINASTLERQLIWVELDANNTDPAEQALIIRPARNFEEGNRYIAVIRNARDAEGELLPVNELFRAYRDGIDTGEPVFEARREAMEDIFAILEQAGVKRGELTLAWDFTIASQQSLTERLLAIRDDAFARLAGASPSFRITEVRDNPASGLSRNIKGTFDVPNYLNQTGGGVGATFNYASDDPDALPQTLGEDVVRAGFRCQIPLATTDFAQADVQTARAAIYGHGLFGESSYNISGGEFGSSNVRAMQSEHNIMFCATDWIGMSQEDILAGNIHQIMADLTGLPRQLDRSQQGLLNFMFLAELMQHPDGFASADEFRHQGQLVYDPTEVFYDGNSQGGILGGALIATAPNLHRGVLGVPGSNYSLLLRRYGPFEQRFAPVLYAAYPDGLDQSLNFALMQMLWDRAENNGYLSHLAGRHLPNTPADKHVLLHVALGDFQVTQWSAEVMARTIGAAVHEPTARLGESPDSNPLFAIPRIEQYPHHGHGMMIWDSGAKVERDGGGWSGNDFPPTINRGPGADFGNDPHSSPRSTVAARQQKSAFMQRDGAVTDVCGDAPCYSDDYTGVSRLP
ncbi:hypothetical protein SAMN05216578_11235 [Halopseudomonas formosensis]|uniref:Uncharacterized protein n=1 Tax=Halopseudomonas formosensis TaxID=1002526 RepID=A0A1I6C3Y0_9GAMM|nr:hypothetical protein [Halopseudomonas formosensis]SFQ87903.1 hypothetical protein SAMN05216578_11235 [Halopseudomonas formosensis]